MTRPEYIDLLRRVANETEDMTDRHALYRLAKQLEASQSRPAQAVDRGDPK